jgi:hypothetical protein
MEYHCEICEKEFARKQSYDRHLLTNAHLKKTRVRKNTCPCGKSYMYRQSLHVHKKKCEFLRPVPDPVPYEEMKNELKNIQLMLSKRQEEHARERNEIKKQIEMLLENIMNYN